MRHSTRRNPDIMEFSATQQSTDAPTVISGSESDTVEFSFISYTLRGFIADMLFTVEAANLPDFSDKIQISTGTIPAGGVESYGNVVAYRYFRVEVQSETLDTPGVVNLNGLMRKAVIL